MKIGIIHFRAGRTDGVSLEIDKRKHILEALGHTVRIISGPVSQNSDLIIRELEFDSPEINEIKENCFKFFQLCSLSETELMDRISAIADSIETQFMEYHTKEHFDALLFHNIFSHGRHLSATLAFLNVLDAIQIPAISTNHDWYWEREEYQTPAYPAINRFLDTYLPPKLKNITHICINSMAGDELKRKTGIDATVLPDIFDFDQPAWEIDDFNQSLPETLDISPNDLVVLQATRIVRRKNIETAIHFVKELERKKSQLIDQKIYNGKTLSDQSRIILLLAGYAEKSARQYLTDLKDEIPKCGIEARFAHHFIQSKRSTGPDKKYSLWDAYAHADLVTYPSLVEGWGNQFIEAVFARKPVVLYEYPVFKKDIKQEGYFYISFGDKVFKRKENGLVIPDHNTINKAVEHTVHTLISNDTNTLLEKNVEIGKKYHGFHVMSRFLSQALVRP